MLVLPLMVFFVVLAAGFWLGELGIRQIAGFLAIWAFCLFVSSALDLPAGLLVVVEVVLDLILILMVFGGDIRLRSR